MTLLQILSITNNVVTIGSWSRCLCTQSLGVTDIALKLSPIYMNPRSWISEEFEAKLTQFCITDFADSVLHHRFCEIF